MEIKRCLITGGCGFIGRHLVDGFVKQGYDVSVLDFGGKPFRTDVRFIDADICDKQAVIQACEGVHTIIHNASIVHTKQSLEDKVWAVNHQGTLNVIEACKKHKVAKLIYISSASAVYEGVDIENGHESLPYSSISQAAYADSKIQAEKDVLAFNGVADTACCAIRPHVVFGPGDNRLIPSILEKAKAGQLKRAIGHRDKLSDFTYVLNLVDAVVAADNKLGLDSVVAGQAYFITNAEPMAFFDFVDDVLRGFGYSSIKKEIPFFIAYLAACVVEAWDKIKGSSFKEGGLTRFAVKYMVTHHYFSIDKASRELDWQPIVSIAEGIQMTVDDFKARGH
ncbi:MAG: NAD-dependent epimerase/dehydratase family protein [Pseudomonadales bacterium]|nr:NAD-dependent epimerase/dehydratase family protein [Pseudomonadales bacterium]